MSSLWHDFVYAIRRLRKDPQLVIVVTIVLGLGIGASTAIFGVVHGVLLEALPYKDPQRLVVILSQSVRQGGQGSPVAPANFYDWREQSDSFESMSAAELWGPTLTGYDVAEELRGLRASANLFETLGVAPLLGRGFSPENETTGGERVVVLSHSLWQRRFGSRPDILDHRVRLDGEIYAVAGVMPPGFQFPTFWARRVDLWTPLIFTPERAQDRTGSSLRVFARLKQDRGLGQAQTDMSTVTARLAGQFPQTNSDLGAVVELLSDKTVAEVAPTIRVLAGAVGFLLLIGCVNVANLLLARVTAREQEVALRLALGAGRWSIVRQFLAESVVLTTAAGLAGVLVASWCLDAVLAAIPEGTLPRPEAIAIDGLALGFALLLSLLTAVSFGLIPALRTSRPMLASSLRKHGRGARGGGAGIRKALVIGEVSLTLMLLVAAGLLVRSFVKLQAIDPGFEPRNVITMVVPVTGSQFGTRERKGPFYEQLVESFARLPGVESAAAVNHIPLEGDRWGAQFLVEGHSVPAPAEVPSAAYRVATPGYFQTMGARLARGRDFTVADRGDAPQVLIVNETLARRYFGSEDAIGKRLRPGGAASTAPWRTIVGVVEDLQQLRWAETDAELYVPFAQDASFYSRPSTHLSMTLVARTTGNPVAMVKALQQEVWALDSNIPVSRVVTMEQAVSNALWQPRFSMLMLAVFAVAAMLLAAAGVYGVISYAVTERTGEIGVRLALGARQGDVLRLVLRQGLLPAVVGIAVGLGGAYAFSHVMAHLLYEVGTADPMAFLGAPALLLLVAALACYLPARRASRIDPIEALRHE